MSDTVAAETTATEEKREAPPALHMHDVERTYRQGDETLHILRGADLAIWAGQSVALLAPSGGIPPEAWPWLHSSVAWSVPGSAAPDELIGEAEARLRRTKAAARRVDAAVPSPQHG